MILESILSCSYLFLTCGSCIYTLIKHSRAQYSKLFTHLMCACCGLGLIATRSCIVLAYKLFYKPYTFDPMMIKIEEERNKGKLNAFDEILGTLSMAGLIYSLYCHHGYGVVGTCVVTSISIFDAITLHLTITADPRVEEIKTSQFHYIPSPLETPSEPRSTVFIWVLVSVYFACRVGNKYALAANYPYLLTNWAVTPEGFYQGWTIRRTINDYMMAAYAICVTEALRVQ